MRKAGTWIKVGESFEYEPETAKNVEITSGSLRIDGSDFPWHVLEVVASVLPNDVTTIQVTIPVSELKVVVGAR